ncbi:MAG: translation initiation factor IF-2, partial [Candidatus Thermoplasmatota archaeon]|nr:translation initiation factor IF-2 [Candidatus Thermoplasmatota archaeon]
MSAEEENKDGAVSEDDFFASAKKKVDVPAEKPTARKHEAPASMPSPEQAEAPSEEPVQPEVKEPKHYDYIRQPIVSVLGHVDHGKTTLLDTIRGTTVASREAGYITQHIGATEMPIEAIYDTCGKLLAGKKFKVPGLLFIDTPGHHAFTTLRARGGSLADIAILVVDINEGFMPQTIEALNVLKYYKTPFVIAANKIDKIQHWRSGKEPFILNYKKQSEDAKQNFDNKMYDLIGKLYELGFGAERYDKVTDFTKNIAIMPVSAITGEGIADLLMMLIGLAQRFLEEQLGTEKGAAQGIVLEVKEEKGLGTTMNTIVYNGTLHINDTIVVGGKHAPITTKVKAILRPKPLDEMRDPTQRFDSFNEVSAAAGIKMVSPDVEDVMAGATIKVASPPTPANIKALMEEIAAESKITIETSDKGLFIKADTIGSLEALASEMKEKGIAVRKAEVGDISKRDINETAALTDPMQKAIFAFNVKVLPDAEMDVHTTGITVIQDNIIYGILDKYGEWKEKRKLEQDKMLRDQYVYPGMIQILPRCLFRASNPAVVGVRVLAGRLKPAQPLIRDGDG